MKTDLDDNSNYYFENVAESDFNNPIITRQEYDQSFALFKNEEHGENLSLEETEELRYVNDEDSYVMFTLF